MRDASQSSSFALSDSVLDALEEAIVWHAEGHVTGLNDAAARLLGVLPDVAAGRPLIEVVRDHRLEHAAYAEQTVELELGDRLVRARGAKGGLILADVTLERRRERELREVTAVLSHEFRTPVTALKGLLEALAVVDDDAMRGHFVNLGLQEIERLVRLVEDLAVEFRPRAERTFVFGEAVDRVLRLTHEEFARRGVRVRVRGRRATLRCDPDKFVQVLINLLENAARHGPNPGEVTVCAERRRGEAMARVLVTDEGAPCDEYESLFEARRRGPSSRGSGMGLYIVGRVVRSWNGEVWGRAHGKRERGGNEFGFTVPLAEPGSAEAGQAGDGVDLGE